MISTSGPAMYPCDRGSADFRMRGWHHFEAGPSGIAVCRYCGKQRPETALTKVHPTTTAPFVVAPDTDQGAAT